MITLRAKLRSRRGLTLTEVLAALLILALATVGVAAGVNASLRVYRESVRLSDAQTLSSTLAIALFDELRYARNPSDDSTAVFTSGTFGADVSVGGDGDGHVTVGGEKLIGDGAYAGLAADANVTYHDGIFDVTLKICLPGDNGQMIREIGFSVRPLNG